jgi:DNA-binding beta-propeller fold protein YncE
MDDNEEEATSDENEPLTIETMIQRRILLNSTPENQELAKSILEFMGEDFEDEDEGLDFVRILNNNLAQGAYLQDRNENDEKDDVVYDTKVSVFITVLSKEGDFEDPRGIVCKNGEIFVADGGLSSLVQLNSDKTIKKLIEKEPLNWPIGICRGFGENEILVSDVTNNMIVSYNTASSESKIFAGCGKEGHKDGSLKECELNGPRGLYNDKDRIIVSDSSNNTIRIIQNNQITTRSIDKEKLSLPTGVCLDEDGNIYICDCENHCIQKLSKDDVLTVVAGAPGKPGHKDGPGKSSLLNWPYAIVNIQGNFIFCEAGNGTLRVLKKDGTVSTLIRGVGKLIKLNDRVTTNFFGNNFCLGAPRGLYLDDDKNLLVTESMSSRVSKIYPIDWETTKWLLLIQRSKNLMSTELLPDIFNYIGWMAYTSWRF